jgi:hypothetical protein
MNVPGDDSRPAGSALRKWGPLTAIVTAVTAVAVLVTVRGPDEGAASTPTASMPATVAAPTTAAASPGDPSAPGAAQPGARPDGPISFSEAEALGLELAFPASCDPATGRVAIPYYFAPECYATVDDNGGATAPGVTADAITVVVYLPPEQDPALDYVTSAITSDDTTEQQRATIEGYAEMFGALYQTYGRTVQLRFLQGSGPSNDEVAARADAVRAVEELGAFAVWGSPALTDAWSEEIAARGVICIDCNALPEPNPNIFTTPPAPEQSDAIVAEYLLAKLAGRPAAFAGSSELRERERVFGHLYIEVDAADAERARRLQEVLAAGGSGFAEQLPYTLDPARLQEQAASLITRLKAAGVTTVVVQSDPVAMATFTQVATAQEFFPEWVIGPSQLVDTAAFARTYDQRQWAHAFGLSPRAAPLDRSAVGTLYDWWFGSPAPADDTEATLSPAPSVFFAAIQRAGPELTTDSLRAGLYATEPIRGSVTEPCFSYGFHDMFPTIPGPDQGGVDDWAEIWWDPEAVGPDELGRVGDGLYRYVDGARRYQPGEIDTELRVFDAAGTVTVFDERPPSEAAKIGDYDPHPR